MRRPAGSPQCCVWPRAVNHSAAFLRHHHESRLSNHQTPFPSYQSRCNLLVLLFASAVCFCRMSQASKLTLAGTGLLTAGIVYFVHWSQEQEKAVRYSDSR